MNVEKLVEELVNNVKGDGSGLVTPRSTAVILDRLREAAFYLARWSTFEGEAETFFANLGEGLRKAVQEEESK